MRSTRALTLVIVATCALSDRGPSEATLRDSQTVADARAAAIPLPLCRIAAPPERFAPPNGQPSYGPGGKFKQGFTSSLAAFTYAGARRLAVRENYGYSLYDLTDPHLPAYSEACDVEGVAGFGRLGDVFNTVVSLGAAPDGSRLLVSYRAPHGSLLMARAYPGRPGCTFNLAGEFTPRAGGGEYVTGAYRGIALASGVSVADVTTPLRGAEALTPNSIPSMSLTGAPVAMPDAGAQAGPWVVYPALASPLVVVTDGVAVYSFSVQSVGFPAGTQALTASAAMHANGSLYLLVEATGGNGWALVRMGSPGLFARIGGIVHLAAGWVEVGSSAGLTLDGDAVFVAWARDVAVTVQAPVVFSANAWGANLMSVSGVGAWFGNPVFNRAVQTGAGMFEVYTGTKQYGYATTIRCGAKPKPPVGGAQ